VGGYNSYGYLFLAELFDPQAGVWKSAGCSSVSRKNATVTPLPGLDRMLISGGYSPTDQTSVDLYFPASP
jgi:hypothetical protein